MNQKLQMKLILPAIVLVSFVASLIAYNSYNNAYDSLRSQVAKSAILASNSISNSLELWHKSVHRQLENTADQEASVKILERELGWESAKKVLTSDYNALVSSNSAYLAIGLLNLDGKLIISSESNVDLSLLSANPEYMQAIETKRPSYVNDFELGSGLSIVYFPLVRNDRAIGVLVAFLDLNVFAANYFDIGSVGKNVVIALLDKKWQPILSNRPIVGAEFIEQNEEFGTLTLNFGTQNFLASFKKNANIEINSLVAISESEVFAGVNQTRLHVFALLVGVAMVTVLIFLVNAKSVLLPVQKATRYFKESAGDKLDLSKRLEINSRDEMGVFAGEFNQFISTLRLSIDATKTTCRSLTESSDGLVKQIGNSRIVNEAVLEQSEFIKSSVDELSENAREVERVSQSGLDDVSEIAKKVQEGLETVKKQTSLIQGLSDSLYVGRKQTDDLNQVVDKVGEVVEIINSIAEQTNLLALNAAIEAARAGEQGRGFAVVADEVRTLAQKTQASVSEIHSTVSEVQDGAEHVLENFANSLSQVSQTIEISDHSKIIFDEIGDQLGEMLQTREREWSSYDERLRTSNLLKNQMTKLEALSLEFKNSVKKTEEQVINQREEIGVLKKNLKLFI